jgi:hypothetical protein
MTRFPWDSSAPKRAKDVVVAFVGGVAEPFLGEVLVLVGSIDDVPPRGMKRPLKLEDFIAGKVPFSGEFLRKIAFLFLVCLYKGLRRISGAFA